MHPCTELFGLFRGCCQYRQYLRKKQEAEQMRQEFDSMAVAQQAGDADGSTAAGSAVDLSLKPGQTIKLNLSSVSAVDTVNYCLQ